MSDDQTAKYWTSVFSVCPIRPIKSESVVPEGTLSGKKRSTWSFDLCSLLIHSSKSPKNKVRCVKGIGEVYFSVNQVIIVMWGVEISREAIFLVFPSRITSANSWEREKSAQIPSLFSYTQNWDYHGQIRIILGRTCVLGQSDIPGTAVLMWWTKIPLEGSLSSLQIYLYPGVNGLKTRTECTDYNRSESAYLGINKTTRCLEETKANTLFSPHQAPSKWY